MKRPLYLLLVLFIFTLLLAACSPAAAPSEAPPILPTQSQAVASEPESTQVPAPTHLPEGEVARPTTTPQVPVGEVTKPTATPQSTRPAATATSILEQRMVELEWPPTMRYGDSDAVRLALVPSEEGYQVTTDFPDHQTQTDQIDVPRPEGYELYAVARLDGVGFAITPRGEQAYLLPPGEAVSWRWTLGPNEPGQQRLSVTLFLRWIPDPGSLGQIREAIAYSRSLDIQVVSFFGLTRRQAMMGGFFGLLFGGGLSLFTLLLLVRTKQPPSGGTLDIKESGPVTNLDLAIEHPAELALSQGEECLLQRLFHRYDRLVLEKDFPAGYSGARTLLVLPIRPDGRADAHTVVKIDQAAKIQREYQNYEHFVKRSLPPMTARIQGEPVVLAEPSPGDGRLGALQYTFIAEPGRMPLSLREKLSANPDPGLLWRLFETFGPNWWMQRKPYTFTLAREYDRVLPVHYVVEPASGAGRSLDGSLPPAEDFAVGEIVRLRDFEQVERRPDGVSQSLKGRTTPGYPCLRVRWRGLQPPEGATGKIVATRATLLVESVSDLERYSLPDPLAELSRLLREKVTGTLATIHGDLNLENVMIGPGDMVWLIDFATTRDGHTLYDFAHLKAEIIAHLVAPQIRSPEDFIHLLAGEIGHKYENLGILLGSVDEIARRCLFNSDQPREYDLAVFMACVGALKYANLYRHQKQLLYLTAAYFSHQL